MALNKLCPTFYGLESWFWASSVKILFDDRILSSIISKFCFYYYANLRELINFYSPWNYQKTYGYIILGGIEVN